jgi:hypothetical protein
VFDVRYDYYSTYLLAIDAMSAWTRQISLIFTHNESLRPPADGAVQVETLEPDQPVLKAPAFSAWN